MTTTVRQLAKRRDAQTSMAGAWWVSLLSSVLVAVFMQPIHAQELDPPDRAGRLAEVRGQVWLQGAGTGNWIGAVRNQPLTRGDRLATDPGARAEVEVGSTSVRLDGTSEIEVLQLDDRGLVLGLASGSVSARVRDLGAVGHVEVETAEGRFVVLRPGTVRIDRQGANSDLTVYSGAARYEGPSSAIAIESGQRAQFFIDGSGVAQYSLLAPVNDEFAAWNNSRESRTSVALAERYVSPEMTGAADLDAYGRWNQDPDYGAVWTPTTVAADWAPYTAGHWTYVQPWGWSWVDDAPWGFAPFHYGRWAHVRNRWCWVPGQRVARPVYAPALVAWVGPPPDRGRFAGGPPVGWVPLAPREVYVPGYRVSGGYARELNWPNVPNFGAIDRVFERPQAPRDFANRGAPRGLTMVPPEVLIGRRPVAPGAAPFRQQPWVREIAGQRGGIAPTLTPPVGAPIFRSDGRAERGPPSWSSRPDWSRPDGTRPDRTRSEQAGPDRTPAAPIGIGQTTPEPRVGQPGDARIGQPPIDGRVGQPPLDGRVGQPFRDGRVGQPFHDGRVGQPFVDGRVGQPPLDGRVGQPQFGRSPSTGLAPNPSPGRGLPATGVTAPPPVTGTMPPNAPSWSNTPSGSNAPGLSNVPSQMNAPTMQPFPIRRGEDRQFEERRSGDPRFSDGRRGDDRRGDDRRGETRPGFQRQEPPSPARLFTPATPMERPGPAAPAAPMHRLFEAPAAPRALEAPRPTAAPAPALAPAPQMQHRGEPRGSSLGERRSEQQR